MKRLIVVLFIAMTACHSTSVAQQDSAAYKSATAISDPAKKQTALEEFVSKYPESKLRGRAYNALFNLHADNGNEPASLNAADRYLQSLSPEARMNPYNSVAYTLALKNIGLDSALVYILRAEEMAQKSSPRSLSGFQDTRAYVLYQKGMFKEAEDLQRTAIKGNEEDTEFLTHLALYETANGKRVDGLQTMSKALYLGGEPESKQYFLDWIAQAEKEKPEQEKLKQSVVMKTVLSYTDTLKGKTLIAKRSKAAILMADLGVDLPLAKQWAEAAVGTLDKNSSIEDAIAFHQSLAFTLSAIEKHKEALAELRSIEDLVDSYDARYWESLGNTYGKPGDTRNAIAAYMNGLIPSSNPGIRRALEETYTKEHGSLTGLDEALDSLRRASGDFDPGTYGKQTMPAGKVILAELFTGAECNPCVGSDIAFDALSEYYPRTAVAILEYHVHVPGPDPMTTNETWERYNWYNGDGTPTVVVDGRESILGGGSKSTARNRFNVYRYAIRKFESEKPRVTLSLDVKRTGDDIAVEANIGHSGKFTSANKPAVHIALVERSVDYTGGNGIAKHLFVVRKMADGSNGASLQMKPPREKVSKKFDIAAVEKSIKEYLDSPTTQPSWSTRRPFSGWHTRPEKLNRSNLAIVSWVQDMQTKEVLQSVYYDLPTAMGMK